MAVSVVAIGSALGRHLITDDMTEYDPTVLDRMSADEHYRAPYFSPIADVLAAAEASAKRVPVRASYSAYVNISDPNPGRGGLKCLRWPDTPPQNDAGVDGGDAGPVDGGPAGGQ